MAGMPDTMLLRVATPLGAIVEEPVVSVALSTAMGEIEVLLGHAPIVVLLEPGEMRMRGENGVERAYAAGEGFARIDQRSDTVFSDMMENAESIEIEHAEDAKGRAEKALSDAASLSPDQRDAADLVLRESLVKIEMSLRRKGQNQRRAPAPRQ
jgi:F-type H+-transporting ATPase subunit epsilon